MLDLEDLHPETPTLKDLRRVFGALTPEAAPKWGTMRATEMVVHCVRFIELSRGRLPVSRLTRLAARGLGPMFLRRVLRGSPAQTPRGLRTLGSLRVSPHDDLRLDEERGRLLGLFEELESLDGVQPHPLYGNMHAGTLRALVRHHTAHHAHQFGLLDSR